MPTAASFTIIGREESTRSQTEFDVSTTQSLPRVDVVLSYVDADAVMIEAAVQGGRQRHRQRRDRRRPPNPRCRTTLSTGLIAEHGMSDVSVQPRRFRPRRAQPGLERSAASSPPTICNRGRRAFCFRWRSSKTNDADDIQRMFDTY